MSYIRKTYATDQLRNYSLLFSSSEINKFVSEGKSKLINYCLREYDNRAFTPNKTYGEYYKYLYKVLLTHYTNEYIYKNEFLNKFLYKKYAGEDCYFFSELNLGNVVADLASFNGESIGFEIKTELDTPSRLTRQMEVYSQVFNKVYLIIPSEAIELYKPFFQEGFGIISYSKDFRAFKLIQESKTKKAPNPQILMEILLTKEYRQIVEEYYGKGILEKSTDFTQFSDCSTLIANIPPKELNRLFISIMKCRRLAPPRFSYGFNELNQVLLSTRAENGFKEKLQYRLNQNISYIDR